MRLLLEFPSSSAVACFSHLPEICYDFNEILPLYSLKSFVVLCLGVQLYLVTSEVSMSFREKVDFFQGERSTLLCFYVFNLIFILFFPRAVGKIKGECLMAQTNVYLLWQTELHR